MQDDVPDTELCGVSRTDSGAHEKAAADTAKSKLAPTRVGYGRTNLDLNVNRDLFNSKQEWRQGPNPEGASDKTLAVVEFVGAADVPVGVHMNYAMHPINFYLSDAQMRATMEIDAGCKVVNDPYPLERKLWEWPDP